MSKMAKGIVALGAVAMLTLSACSADTGSGSGDTGSTSEDKGALAMSFAGRGIQIWDDMLPFMENVVEEAGYTFVTDNPEWNAQTQVEDWENWNVQGDVSVIMGYPAQSDSMVPVTQQAIDAGITVLAYGSQWEGVEAAVLMDHYADGVVLGEDVIEWIKETYGEEELVDVALLNTPETDLGRFRGEGITDTLENSGLNIRLTEQRALNIEEGYAAAQNQLQAFPDTKVWLSISNDQALGAYQALTDSGVSSTDPGYLVANLDGTDAELEYVMQEDNIWRMIYMVPARIIAEANAHMMVDAAEGKDVADVTLPQIRVTSENAESMLLANQ